MTELSMDLRTDLFDDLSDEDTFEHENDLKHTIL
jgi:hypothetical protein